MAFEPKPNNGTLWPNDRKTAANHPDVRGDIFLDKTMLEGLMAKAVNGMVKVSLSGWNKTIANKAAISLSASEPWEGSKPTVSDDDLPY